MNSESDGMLGLILYVPGRSVPSRGFSIGFACFALHSDDQDTLWATKL